MIITCEKCSTKFNFDESLLKETGSKVRCSKCKHIFTAYPSTGKVTTGKAGNEISELSYDQPASQTVTPEPAVTPGFSESVVTPVSEPETPEQVDTRYEEDYGQTDKTSEKVKMDSAAGDAESTDSLQFNDDFDIENIEDLDLSLDSDGFEAEPGHDLDDFEISIDSGDDAEIDFNLEKSSKSISTGKFDHEMESEPQFEPELESEPELELESKSESEPESEPDDGSEFDFEFESETGIETEADDDYDFSFDDDDFKFEDFEEEEEEEDETEKTGAVFETEPVPEEDLELELDLEDGDELSAGTELKSTEEKEPDISFQDDVSGNEDVQEDELGDGVYDEFDLDFSKFEGTPGADFDMEFEDKEGKTKSGISFDADGHEKDFAGDTNDTAGYGEIDEDGLEFSEFGADSSDDDISLEFEEISDVAVSDEKESADMGSQSSSSEKTDGFEESSSTSSSPEDDSDTGEGGTLQSNETEEHSFADLSSGFAMDNNLKKPAKKFGKSVFIILFLLIFLLAGYSISIMQGINIPYVSDIKVPFLTRYLTEFTNTRSSHARLIPDKQSVNGRFVTNSVAGTLFVITGKIRNSSTFPCSYVRVTGTLITKNKIKIRKKTVFCGNLIPENKLDTLTMKNINIILSKKSGSNNLNVNIAPGRFVPFMIVFSKLPDNLQNFTINVAGFERGIIKK